MTPRTALDDALAVYLVTDEAICDAAGRTVADTARLAVAGGVTCVQVRSKSAPARDFLAQVLAVAEAVGDRVPVLVNDRVDVFLAARDAGAGVAGVHVGQSDLPALAVRRTIGADAVLGLSAATPDEIARAAADAVDYIGIGPVYDTATKADAPAGGGIEWAAGLAARSSLPAVAIGGITAADAAPLARAGFAGAAVVSAICAAGDPAAAARTLADEWRAGR